MTSLQLYVIQPQGSMVGFSVQLHLQDFVEGVEVRNPHVLQSEVALPSLVHNQAAADNLDQNRAEFLPRLIKATGKGAELPAEAGCLLAAR